MFDVVDLQGHMANIYMPICTIRINFPSRVISRLGRKTLRLKKMVQKLHTAVKFGPGPKVWSRNWDLTGNYPLRDAIRPFLQLFFCGKKFVSLNTKNRPAVWYHDRKSKYPITKKQTKNKLRFHDKKSHPNIAIRLLIPFSRSKNKNETKRGFCCYLFAYWFFAVTFRSFRSCSE